MIVIAAAVRLAAEAKGDKTPREARLAAARFPSTPLAIASSLVDGVTFATAAAILEGSASFAGGVALIAVGCTFVAAALVTMIIALLRCPLTFVAVPDDVQRGILLLPAWQRLLLSRRGSWLPRTEEGGMQTSGESPTMNSDAAVAEQPLHAETYLSRYHSVIAPTRGGKGWLLALATWSVPIDLVLTIASSLTEAIGALHCHDIVTYVALCVMGCAFFNSLVVAPHPSHLKAVLAAVGAAFSLLVAVFVLLAKRGGDSRGTWISAGQVASLTASGVGATNTGVSVLVWLLGRRARKFRKVSKEPPGNEDRGTAPLLTISQPTELQNAAGSSTSSERENVIAAGRDRRMPSGVVPPVPSLSPPWNNNGRARNPLTPASP